MGEGYNQNILYEKIFSIKEKEALNRYIHFPTNSKQFFLITQLCIRDILYPIIRVLQKTLRYASFQMTESNIYYKL